MRFFPHGELLQHLEAQGLKTPEDGYLISEPELVQVVGNLKKQLPSEKPEALTVRALYFLVWRDYANAETAATGDGADAIDSRRIQGVQEAQKKLFEEELPALAKSLGWMTKEVTEKIGDAKSELCRDTKRRAEEITAALHDDTHATQALLISSAESIEGKIEQTRLDSAGRDRGIIGILDEFSLSEKELHDETVGQVDQARHLILLQMGELHAQVRDSFIEQERKVKGWLVQGLGVAFLLFLALLGAVVAGHCQQGLDGLQILDEGSATSPVARRMAGIAKINFAGSGVSCVWNSTDVRWDCTIGGGGGAHTLLGVTHSDTTTGTAARGDLITGQGVSPTWTRLAKGTADFCLRMDGTGTDVVWAACPGAGGGDSLTVGGVAATDPNFIDSTWIDFVLDTAATPDTITGNIIGGSISATELGADSVSDSELNATGVEAELEAVLDLDALQGQSGDAQIADAAVDGGTGW